MLAAAGLLAGAALAPARAHADVFYVYDDLSLVGVSRSHCRGGLVAAEGVQVVQYTLVLEAVGSAEPSEVRSKLLAL